MDKADKRIFWEKHLADWSSSGISQNAYCAQQTLNPSNFSYWKRQLRSAGASHPKLIPVTMPARAVSVRITASGVQMDVPVERLEQVLPILWRSLREKH